MSDGDKLESFLSALIDEYEEFNESWHAAAWDSAKYINNALGKVGVEHRIVYKDDKWQIDRGASDDHE